MPSNPARRALLAALPLLVLLVLVHLDAGLLVRTDRLLSDRLTAPARHHATWAHVLRELEIWTRGPTWWVAGAVAVLAAGPRRDHGRTARWAALAAVAAALLTPALKLLVARPRPALVGELSTASGWAFPSGHATSSAVGVGVVLVALLPRLPSARARGTAKAVGVATVLAVGLDRVLIGAHWPTDVVGGWSLAAAVLWAAAGVRPSAGRPARPRQGVPRSPGRASDRGR